jgi:hypothetical protein
VAWLAANILLIVALLAVAYSASWEFSPRRYLKGFSDAIVPATGEPLEKIIAILNWMSNGPARELGTPDSAIQDRDPQYA